MGSHQTFSDADLGSGLQCCEALLADSLASVTRLYGSHGLGIIDLPSLAAPGQIVPAQVNNAAVLYWCAQVEEAGILVFVEALAKAMYTGQLNLAIQNSAHKLRIFWRNHEHRFSAAERQTLYRQVLDANQRGAFDQQLLRFANALVAIGRAAKNEGTLHQQSQAAYIAHEMASGLSDRGVGISGYAGRDIVQQIRDAQTVLSDMEIQHALGGGPLALIIRRWSPRLFLGREFNTGTHIHLANTGVDILRWLAREGPQILNNQTLLTRTHPLIRLAETWLANRQTLGSVL